MTTVRVFVAGSRAISRLNESMLGIIQEHLIGGEVVEQHLIVQRELDGTGLEQ